MQYICDFWFVIGQYAAGTVLIQIAPLLSMNGINMCVKLSSSGLHQNFLGYRRQLYHRVRIQYFSIYLGYKKASFSIWLKGAFQNSSISTFLNYWINLPSAELESLINKHKVSMKLFYLTMLMMLVGAAVVMGEY